MHGHMSYIIPSDVVPFSPVLRVVLFFSIPFPVANLITPA